VPPAGHLSLDVGSDEGPSDAPVWSPSAKRTGASEDSAAASPPLNVEVDLPSGVDVRLPNIPKVPE
jgi:hypothetical protein